MRSLDWDYVESKGKKQSRSTQTVGSVISMFSSVGIAIKKRGVSN